LAAPLFIVTLGACREPLVVQNLDNPDVDRVFALPATIEQTIGSGYQTCRNVGQQDGGTYTQLNTMALEGYSQLNNFNMGPRASIPRTPILNNRTTSEAFTEFSGWSRQSRTEANAVAALDRLTTGGGTLGTKGADLRTRAFGFFVVACNLGHLALTFDSAAIVKPGMPSDETPDLSGAQAVMSAALAMMDTAIAIANKPEAAAGFPTPTAWMSGPALSKDQFVRFVRSFKARFRAGVARTPAQRAAVDWNAVLADADNGLTADLVVSVGGTSGWNRGWPGGTMHTDAAWHQISLMYWGFADTSGAYSAWLKVPLLERDYFLVKTPDKRWPAGETRAAQQDASKIPTSYTAKPYLQNRTDQDTPGAAWGTSFYNHFRYRYVRLNANAGALYPEFLRAELDLLAAEALIRLNRIPEAATRLDLTRVPNGLEALAGRVTTATEAVPGGAHCVPRVPDPATNFTSAACGNIFEAMKYEKRTEIAFGVYAAEWFFDSRGWGDLVLNTPVEYPVPQAELDARQKAFYNLGGGGPSSAAKGTYGF
jgi:hypothetical protein